MNRSALIAGGIALGIAAAPALAQETASRTWVDYLSAQLAISDVDGFDNGLAMAVTAGKNLAGMPGLAVEAELTTTISKPEASIGAETADVSYWTLAGYGVYALPLNESFSVRGRLGVLYENVDISSSLGSDSDSEFGVSVGVGGLMRINENMNVIAEYTRIEEDVSHLSAGVQFKF